MLMLMLMQNEIWRLLIMTPITMINTAQMTVLLKNKTTMNMMKIMKMMI